MGPMDRMDGMDMIRLKGLVNSYQLSVISYHPQGGQATWQNWPMASSRPPSSKRKWPVKLTDAQRRLRDGYLVTGISGSTRVVLRPCLNHGDELANGFKGVILNTINDDGFEI